MKKHNCGCISPPPKREELTDNPVKLCHDIARLGRAKNRETVIEGVMSQPGARLVLSFLAVSDGKSQKELVELTHLRAPTVSVILQKMEDEGIAERRRNPEDKRELRVYLTEYGREVDRNGIAKIKQTDALALEGLSPQEIETLMTLLGKMKENLLVSLSESRKERKE